MTTTAIDTRDLPAVPVRVVVTERLAKMPTSCRAAYVRVAAMLMLADAEYPAMISDRTAGCVQVLTCSYKVPRKGKTLRSGRMAAYAEARNAEAEAPRTVAWADLTGRQQKLAAALAITAALRALTK